MTGRRNLDLSLGFQLNRSQQARPVTPLGDIGALVVYDAATLEEMKRLPMKKPPGKYNVSNKIMLSAGSSH